MSRTNIVIVLQTIIAGGDGDAASLLKRAYQFLEEGDWYSAYIYCDRVLDIDPENAAAYVGKLMADLKVRKPNHLEYCEESFEWNRNYRKALRYADQELKDTLTGYVESIKQTRELDRLDHWYNSGKKRLAEAEKDHTAKSYADAASSFEWAENYKDAAALAQKCRSKAEVLQKDETLAEARKKMNTGSVADCEEALKLLESIPKWKDSPKVAADCRKKIRQLTEKEEADRREAERQAELARQEAERRALQKKKRIKLAAVCACAAVVFGILLNTLILPAVRYSSAMSALEAGQVEEAQALFRKLGNYKDAREQAGAIRIAGIPENVRPGSTIVFGSYEQDNETSNGREDIEWTVLDVKEDWAFVISKEILDYQPYHDLDRDVTWETCSLRQWLNEDFFEKAFSDREKAMIPTVIVKADENPKYDTDPGNATEDKVYVLSLREADYYYPTGAPYCYPTPYAIENGAYADRMSGDSWWWLRSPGKNQHYAANCQSNHGFSSHGSEVTSTITSVRPVLWIDLAK